MRALIAVGTLAAGALAGCGAGVGGGGGGAGRGGASGGSTSVSSAAAARGAVHWLAATSGAAPTIRAENAQPGTRAWREGDRDTRRSRIDAYVSAQDVRPGEQETVFVRAGAVASSVRIRLFRVGWYSGAGARLMGQTGSLRTPAQPACVHVRRTGETACAWHPTLTFTVPAALPSGIYLVNIVAGGRQRDALFVLEAARAAPMLAHISTATYQAYNDWGGASLYPGGKRVGVTGTSQGVVVSYDRPYATTTGAGELFARDVAMVRFLEREGYPLSYETSTSRADAVTGARVLVDIGHSEYWSAGERAAWTAALARGASLAFFSSDTMAWKVAYRGHEMVGYKEHASLDPTRQSGAFGDLGAALTGSAYTGCITPRVPAVGRAEYHYYSWSPVAGPLLGGTGLTPRSRVPLITGYELDARTRKSPPGVKLVGLGVAPCQRGGGVAQSTLYAAPSGGLVFATGTLGWGFGVAPLPDPGADVQQRPNPGLTKLTRNVLGQMLARRVG